METPCWRRSPRTALREGSRPRGHRKEERTTPEGDRRREVLRGLPRRRDHRRTRSQEIPSFPLENTLTRPRPLRHLLWQLHMRCRRDILETATPSSRTRRRGLLRASVEEIANLGRTVEEVDRRAHVQAWTRRGSSPRLNGAAPAAPPLGSRDRPPSDGARPHEAAAEPPVRRDRPQMGLTPEEVAHHLEIASASPPSRDEYSPDRSSYIIPDVFVCEAARTTRYPQRRRLPKLRISPTYRRCSTARRRVGGDAHYVRELRSALWLRRAWYQGSGSTRSRSRSSGTRGLRRRDRPPPAAGAARRGTDIGMHESTVRAWWPTSTCTPPGGCSAALLLPQRIRPTWESPSARSRSRQDPEDDRGRGPVASPVRFADRRAAGTRATPGPPHVPITGGARIPPSNLRKSVHYGSERVAHGGRVHRPSGEIRPALRALAELEIASSPGPARDHPRPGRLAWTAPAAGGSERALAAPRPRRERGGGDASVAVSTVIDKLTRQAHATEKCAGQSAPLWRHPRPARAGRARRRRPPRDPQPALRRQADDAGRSGAPRGRQRRWGPRVSGRRHQADRRALPAPGRQPRPHRTRSVTA